MNELNLVIEAIGKVAVEAIAIIVLGAGLYYMAKAFQKISEAFERQHLMLQAINETLKHFRTMIQANNDLMRRVQDVCEKLMEKRR